MEMVREIDFYLTPLLYCVPWLRATTSSGAHKVKIKVTWDVQFFLLLIKLGVSLIQCCQIRF